MTIIQSVSQPASQQVSQYRKCMPNIDRPCSAWLLGNVHIYMQYTLHAVYTRAIKACEAVVRSGLTWDACVQVNAALHGLPSSIATFSVLPGSQKKLWSLTPEHTAHHL